LNTLKRMGSLITLVNGKIAFAASFLIYPLMTVVVIEVLFRYVFNKPTTWAYDLTWMLYAALVFLGGAYGLSDKVHVSADIFYNMLKRRGKAIVNLFCYPGFFFSSMIGLSVSTFFMMIKAIKFNESSPYTSWNPPTWPIKTVLFVSMVILLLQGIVVFSGHISNLRKGGEED